MPLRFTFKKEERLCSKKQIESIFKGKKVLYLFPFSIYYMAEQPTESVPAKVLFSVAKKKFKRAVDRNTIKRRCKEAYRLHKQNLYNELQKNKKTISMVFVYRHTDILPYIQIEETIKQALDQVIKKGINTT